MKTEEEYKAEVLQLMRDLYPTLKGEEKERAERLFPELKESEDEKVWLIKFIQEEIDCLRFDIRGCEDRTKLENLRRSLSWLEKQDEQKPAWSEEDERMFKNTIALIETLEDYNKAPDGFGDVKFWLKSLKDRVQPKPKQGWSERLSKIVGYLRHKGYEDDADWIESFIPRPHWQPSDEQMEQLGWIAEQNKDNMIGKELMTLYQDLKKLREE